MTSKNMRPSGGDQDDIDDYARFDSLTSDDAVDLDQILYQQQAKNANNGLNALKAHAASPNSKGDIKKLPIAELHKALDGKTPVALPKWLVLALEHLDVDNDGHLDRDEIVVALEALAKLKKEKDENSGEIDYSFFPEQVKEVLRVWDNDGSGTVGVHELAAAAKAQERMNQENRFLKKGIMVAAGIITLLILMNFLMGLAAAEAAKDARPASSDSRRRSLAGEYIESAFGGRRELQRGMVGTVPEGAMTTDDMDDGGVVIGTASTLDKFTGMSAIDRLVRISPESVGLIDSLIVPGPNGGLKLGPFTKLVDGADPYEGYSKTFFSAEGTMKLVEPPQWPGDSCGPEPYMEITNRITGEMLWLYEEDIKSDGRTRCPGYVWSRFCGESEEDYQMRLEWESHHFPQEMSIPMPACHPSPTMLTMRGEPKRTDNVKPPTLPAVEYYCGATMQCTAEEFKNWQAASGIPTGERLSDDAIAHMNSTGAMDFLGPDTSVAFPTFNQSLNSSQYFDPSIVAMTQASWENYNTSRRRLMMADLVSGNRESFNQRRRQLAGVHDGSGSNFNVTRAREEAVRTLKDMDPRFSQMPKVDQVREQFCELRPSECADADSTLRLHDKDDNGYLSREEYGKFTEKISKPSDPTSVGAEIKDPAGASEGAKECKFFKNPEKKSVVCNSKKANRDLIGSGDLLALCNKMDKNGNGRVNQKECKEYNPGSTFDAIVNKVASGDTKKKKTAQSEGIPMHACVDHFAADSGSEVTAEFKCTLLDIHEPYADGAKGLTRDEINMDFSKLLHEHAGQYAEDEMDHSDMMGPAFRALQAVAEHPKNPAELMRQKRRQLFAAQGKGSVSMRLALPTRTFLNKKTGRLEKSVSHLHQTGEVADKGFHDLVFEHLLNVPRMLQTEARIVAKERALRGNMKRKLGEHAFEEWLEERTLKSTEKLRRRRMLLAFDEHKDDFEETHRRLRSSGRRLHELSVSAAHNAGSRRELLKTMKGRFLKEESHESDGRLRKLLADETHTISGNHHDYVREFRVKRTSKEMRELMSLTHASKKALPSTSKLFGKVIQKGNFQNSRRALSGHGAAHAHTLPPAMNMSSMPQPSFEAMLTHTEFYLHDPHTIDFAKEAAREALHSFREATKSERGVKRSVPKVRMLNLLSEKLDEGAAGEIFGFLSSVKPDDAVERYTREAGGAPMGTMAAKHNMDGSTAGEVSSHRGVRVLTAQLRVLQDVAERRRLRALDQVDSGNHKEGARKLQEADDFHRLLTQAVGPIADYAHSQVIDAEEALHMFPGEPERVQDMANFCERQTSNMVSHWTGKMARLGSPSRRSLGEVSNENPLGLELHEVRELEQARQLGEHEHEEGMPPTMACTPCMVNAFMDPITMDASMSNPITAHAFETGDPEYCVRAFENFKAISLDKPECTEGVEFSTAGPPMYTSPDGQKKIKDVNSCAMGPNATPLRGDGEMPSTVAGATVLPMTAAIGGRRNLGAEEFSKGMHQFLHKRNKPLTYKEAMKQAMRQRRMEAVDSRRRRLSEGKTTETLTKEDILAAYEPMHEFDSFGRILHDDVSAAACADPSSLSASAAACCRGTCDTRPEQMPSPSREVAATGELRPREDERDVTFRQFVGRTMRGDSPREAGLAKECVDLPELEKRLPTNGRTEDFDIDPNNAFSANLQTDVMGPGCMEECGCVFLTNLGNGKEGIANVCTYQQEQDCPCMKNKKQCHRKIEQAWREKAVEHDTRGSEGGRDERGSRSLRARKLLRKSNIRRSRMDSANFRKLLSFDNKKLSHNVEMARQRRRSLLMSEHGLSEAKVDKLEAAEKKIQRSLGSRHKSLRVLTGKTGDVRRNLAALEKYTATKKRVLQSKRRLGLANSKYSPLGARTPGANTAAPFSPPPLERLGGPGVEQVGQAGTFAPHTGADRMGQDYRSQQMDPIMATTGAPGPKDGSNMLMVPGTAPPSDEYDHWTHPVTLHEVINHGMFDADDNTFYEITNIFANEKREIGESYDGSDPWSHKVCYMKLDTTQMNTSYDAMAEECHDATPYKPNNMGYSPLLTTEMHHEHVYCPTDTMEDPMYAGERSPNGEFYSGTTGAPANKFVSGPTREGGNNLMMDVRPDAGLTCVGGMPFHEGTIDEHIFTQSHGEGTSGTRPEDLYFATREMPTAANGGLERELREFANDHLHRKCTDVPELEMYCHSDQTTDDSWMTEGDAMHAKIQEAFEMPGDFRPEAIMDYPPLREAAKRTSREMGTTPDFERNALLHKTSEVHTQDLRETIMVSMPMGDCPHHIRAADDRAPSLYRTIMEAREDQSEPNKLFVRDCVAFYMKCEEVGFEGDGEDCATIKRVKEFVERMGQMPDDMRPDSEDMMQEVPESELQMLIEMSSAMHSEVIPRGQEGMGAGDYMAMELMYGETGAGSRDQAAMMFEERTEGRGIMEHDRRYEQRSVSEEVRGRMGDKTKSSAEGRRNEEETYRRHERDIDTRERAQKASNRASTDMRSTVDRMKENYRSRRVRRARQLAQRENAAYDPAVHLPRVLSEELHKRSRQLVAELGTSHRSSVIQKKLKSLHRQLTGSDSRRALSMPATFGPMADMGMLDFDFKKANSSSSHDAFYYPHMPDSAPEHAHYHGLPDSEHWEEELSAEFLAVTDLDKGAVEDVYRCYMDVENAARNATDRLREAEKKGNEVAREQREAMQHFVDELHRHAHVVRELHAHERLHEMELARERMNKINSTTPGQAPVDPLNFDAAVKTASPADVLAGGKAYHLVEKDHKPDDSVCSVKDLGTTHTSVAACAQAAIDANIADPKMAGRGITYKASDNTCKAYNCWELNLVAESGVNLYDLDSFGGHVYLNLTEAEDFAHVMQMLPHMPDTSSLLPAGQSITGEDFVKSHTMHSMEMGGMDYDPAMSPTPEVHHHMAEAMDEWMSYVEDYPFVPGTEMHTGIPAKTLDRLASGPTEMGSLSHHLAPTCPVEPMTVMAPGSGMYDDASNGFEMAGGFFPRSLQMQMSGKTKSASRKRKLAQKFGNGQSGMLKSLGKTAVRFGKRRHRRSLLLDTPVSLGASRRSLAKAKPGDRDSGLMLPGTGDAFTGTGEGQAGFDHTVAPGEEIQLHCDDVMLLTQHTHSPASAGVHDFTEALEETLVGDPGMERMARDNFKQASHVGMVVEGGNGMHNPMMESTMTYETTLYPMTDFDRMNYNPGYGVRNRKLSSVQKLRKWYSKEHARKERQLSDTAESLPAPTKPLEKVKIDFNQRMLKGRKLQWDYYPSDSTFPPTLPGDQEMWHEYHPEPVQTLHPTDAAHHIAGVESMLGNHWDATTADPALTQTERANAYSTTTPTQTTTPVHFMHQEYLPDAYPNGDQYSASMTSCNNTMGGCEIEEHYNWTTGDYEAVYVGDNVSYINEYGHPEEHMAVTMEEGAHADYYVEEYFYDEMPPPMVNDTVVDSIAAMVADETGHMPRELGAGYDCDQHAEHSSFAVEVAYGMDMYVSDSFSHHDYYQPSPRDECLHDKHMQELAHNVEDLILTVIERRAQAIVTAGFRKSYLRRALGVSSESSAHLDAMSSNTYLRKLLRIPQAWEVEAARRKLQAAHMPDMGMNGDDHYHGNVEAEKGVIDMFWNSSSAAVTDPFHYVAGAQLEDNGANPHEESDIVFSKDMMDGVESFNEMPKFLMGGGMDLGREVKEELGKIYEMYRKEVEEEYLKARVDGSKFTKMLHIALDRNEKTDLLNDVREIYSTPAPGQSWDAIWSQSDPDQCTQLWEEHLGCYGLAHMSSDWNNVNWNDPNPKPAVDDSATMPHNKCQKFAREFAQKYTGEKRGKMMKKALLRALLLLGDWNTYSSDGASAQSFQNMLSNGKFGTMQKPDAAWATQTCDLLWSGATTYIPKDYSYATKTNANSDFKKWSIQAMLSDTTQFTPATGKTAQVDFKDECKLMLNHLMEYIPSGPDWWGSEVDSTVLTGAKFWRSPWDADQVRRALLIQLDPDYRQEWSREEEKPAGTRLARCAAKSVRENIPEKIMDTIMSEVMRRQRSPEMVMDTLLEPAIEHIKEAYKEKHLGDETSLNSTTSNHFDWATHNMPEHSPDRPHDGGPVPFVETTREHRLDNFTVGGAVEHYERVEDSCKQFCADYLAWEDMNALPTDVKIGKPVYEDMGGNVADAEYSYPGADMAKEHSGLGADTCVVELDCELYKVLESPEKKAEFEDRRHDRRRRRVRRQRRMQILERRRARQLKGTEVVASKKDNCVTLNGEKYCKEGSASSVEQRRLQTQEAAQDLLMERTGGMLVRKARSTGGAGRLPSKRLSKKQLRKKRMMRRLRSSSKGAKK